MATKTERILRTERASVLLKNGALRSHTGILDFVQRNPMDVVSALEDMTESEATGMLALLRAIATAGEEHSQALKRVRNGLSFIHVMRVVESVSTHAERQELLTRVPSEALWVFATVARSPESIQRRVWDKYRAMVLADAEATAREKENRKAFARRVRQGLKVKTSQANATSVEGM